MMILPKNIIVQREVGSSWYNELVRFTTWFKPNSVMLEVGSYAGESANIFLMSGKIHTLFCVDPWQNGYDIYDMSSQSCDMKLVEEVFDHLMLPYSNFVKIKTKSEEAVKMFPNNFFDIVYIDANHQKEEVKKDLSLWLPKVKPDGWLSGHNLDIDSVRDALLETFGRMPDAAFNDTSWVYLNKPTML